MKYKPVGKRLLVRMIDNNKRMTKAGLWLPESDKPTDTGQVLQVSQEIEDSSLKPGDVIVYERYAGVKVDLETGEQGLILSPNDIIAKLG